MFKKKIAFGTKGFPWSINKKKINYNKGLCPIAEKLDNQTLLKIEVCMFDLSENDIKFISKAFKKVWNKFNLN